MTAPHRSGFVALVGRPNVGKSTLLNRLVGQKVAIVSSKAQTTRHRIRGIHSGPGFQMVLVDTPGVHKPLHLLGEHLVKTAVETLKDVDLVLFLVDGRSTAGRGDKYVADLLAKAGRPVMLVVNKIESGKLDPALVETYREIVPVVSEHVVSALYGKGIVPLVADIVARLPEGPALFPDDDVTDQTERDLAGELVREAVLRLTSEEIPHSVAVRVEEFREPETPADKTFIKATLFVERESQKGILIGDKGMKLRELGQTARKSIEKALDRQVYLELWVKVLPNWRKQSRTLKQLGYTFEP